MKRKITAALVAALMLAVPSAASADGYDDRLKTQPATNITTDGATLNGMMRCWVSQLQSAVYWRYEVKINGTWTQVGPERFRYCARQDSIITLEGQPVSGLGPGTYEYRITGRWFDDYLYGDADDGIAGEGVFDALASITGTGRGPVLYDSFTLAAPGPTLPEFFSWYENTYNPPVVSPDSDDMAAGAAAADRCKRGLPNIKHGEIRDPAFPDRFPPVEIYQGGTRTSWCWRGGRITSRRTTYVADWVSPVGDGEVSYSPWSSNCTTGNGSCLVRTEFRSRVTLEFQVGPVTVPVNFRDQWCVGTRVFASLSGDAAHTRNISNGTCPGS